MQKVLKKFINAMRYAPVMELLRRIRQKAKHRKQLKEWYDKGCPVPPPHIVKQQYLRSYAARYKLRTFVESGTYRGDMVEAMKDSFDKVYSIELSRELFLNCCRRFALERHVELVHGDSGVELGNIVRTINRAALFWLDGHYSGGVTTKGSKDTPIKEELQHILESDEPGHVIIIDDARFFGSDPFYPSVDELREFIFSRRTDVEISIKDDSIRVTPRYYDHKLDSRKNSGPPANISQADQPAGDKDL